MGSNYRWLVPAGTDITLTVRAKGYQAQEFKDITVKGGDRGSSAGETK